MIVHDERTGAMVRKQIILGLLIAVIILAGCSGLAGDPIIVSTLPPITPTADYPTTMPDLSVGAVLYQQHCTRCHGIGGAGDGELIGNGKDQIPTPPKSFLDPETTANQTPLMWFDTITNGRVEKLMPPWNNALTNEERWAVALYTYTLHYTQSNVEAGQQLASEQGIAAANIPTADVVAKLTDGELITQLGIPEVELNKLSRAQQTDILAYARSLTVMNPNQMGVISASPAVTPEAGATIPVGSGKITGVIVNGTTGSAFYSDMKASLYVITPQGPLDPIDVLLNKDGRFTIENIDLQTDNRYIVTVNYKGRAYGSEAKAGDPELNTIDLPVTVYETTDDASVLRIEAWVSQIQVISGKLQVTDFIQFTNSSDRAYSTNEKVDDIRYKGVEMAVPNGAAILSVDTADPRYSISANGRSVIDSAPVLPGKAYFFQMVYELPYQGEAAVEQPIPYLFDGAFRLLLGTPTAQVTSAQLPSMGIQTVGSTQYQGYGTSLSLEAGESIQYVVKGGIEGNTSDATSVRTDNLVPLLLILAGIIVVVVVIFSQLTRTRTLGVRKTTNNGQTKITQLLQQIAELDISFHEGKLEEGTYRTQRETLKARLAALIDEQNK